MLVAFTVGNYTSFLSPASFSMVAAENVDCNEESTISPPNVSGKLLKTAVIYGANGSGKSNLIKALADFRGAILNSFIDNRLIKRLSRKYFKLGELADITPRSFESIVLIGSVQYRYGFWIYGGEIVREWLFKKSPETEGEINCFLREDHQVITVNQGSFKVASEVIKRAEASSLFISTCANFGVKEAQKLRNWFGSQLVILGTHSIQSAFDLYRSDPTLQQPVRELMKSINLKTDESKVADKTKPRSIKMESGIPLRFESRGIKEAFALSVYVSYAFANGCVLVWDEFSANLHTELAVIFVKLFQVQYNKNSQLIFATHNTKLLRRDLFREDQIWFTEKGIQGYTNLYSMVDFELEKWRLIDEDSSYERYYLQGRYGAVPCFDDIDSLIKRLLKWQEKTIRLK